MPLNEDFKKAEELAETLEIASELKIAQSLKEAQERDATKALEAAAELKETAGSQLIEELQVLERYKIEIESSTAKELAAAERLKETEEFEAHAALIAAEALKTNEKATFTNPYHERLLEKREQLEKLNLEITTLIKKKDETEHAITSIGELDIEFTKMSSLMHSPPTDWMAFFDRMSRILEDEDKKLQKHIPFKLFDASLLLTTKEPGRQAKLSPNFNQLLSPQFNLLLELLDLGKQRDSWANFRKQQETFSVFVKSFNKEYTAKYEQLEFAIATKKKHVQSREQLKGQKDKLEATVRKITADLAEQEESSRRIKKEILAFETLSQVEECKFDRDARAKEEEINRRIQAATLKLQEVKEASEHRIAAIQSDAQTTKEKLTSSIETIKIQLKQEKEEASRQFEETKRDLLKTQEMNAANAAKTLDMQNARRDSIKKILIWEKDTRQKQEMQEHAEFREMMTLSSTEFHDLNMKMKFDALNIDEQEQRRIQTTLEQDELNELMDKIRHKFIALRNEEIRQHNLSVLDDLITREARERQDLDDSERDDISKRMATMISERTALQDEEIRQHNLSVLDDLITREARERQDLDDSEKADISKRMATIICQYTALQDEEIKLRDLKIKTQLDNLTAEERMKRRAQEALEQAEFSDQITAMQRQYAELHDKEVKRHNLSVEAQLKDLAIKEPIQRQSHAELEQVERSALIAKMKFEHATLEHNEVRQLDLNELVKTESVKRQTQEELERIDRETLTATKEADQTALPDNETRQRKTEVNKQAIFEASAKFQKMLGKLGTQIDNMREYGNKLLLEDNLDGSAVLNLAKTFQTVLDDFNQHSKPISLKEFNQFQEKLRQPLLDAYNRMGNHHAKWKQHILNALLVLTICVSYFVRTLHTKQTIGHSEFFFSKTNRQHHLDLVHHSLNGLDEEVQSQATLVM